MCCQMLLSLCVQIFANDLEKQGVLYPFGHFVPFQINNET